MIETWLSVLGNEDYEVSDLGRVRSLLRRAPQVLKPYKAHKRGYLAVNLMHDGPDGRRVYSPYVIHRLVLSVFTGPPPEPGMHGCHINGDVADNRLENLYWGTPKQNAADMARHGTHRNTAKTHCDKGHEFTKENTVIRKNGARNCLTCKRINERANRLKRLGRHDEI